MDVSAYKKKLQILTNAIKGIETILRRLRIYHENLDLDSGQEIEEKRCVVAIDWDNIYGELKDKDKQFDFSGFINKLSEMGFIIDSLKVFIPYDSYHALPKNVNNLGYEIALCQKMDVDLKSEKREDKVDSYMFMNLRNFLDYQEITHIVILTHDKHSIELLSEAVKKGKKVVYFAEREKMNFRLAEVIDQLKISVYPLPNKDRRIM